MLVKSRETLAAAALRDALGLGRRTSATALVIEVHPDIAAEVTRVPDGVPYGQRVTGKTVLVRPRGDLSLERYTVGGASSDRS